MIRGLLRTARRLGSKTFNVSVKDRGMEEPTIVAPKSSLELKIPEPVELALGTLVACEFHMAKFSAKKLGIELENIKFDNVSCKLKTDFFEGKADAAPQITEVSMDVHVKTKAAKEKFAELVQMIEHGCPLYYLFKKSGATMNVNWKHDS